MAGHLERTHSSSADELGRETERERTAGASTKRKSRRGGPSLSADSGNTSSQKLRHEGLPGASGPPLLRVQVPPGRDSELWWARFSGPRGSAARSAEELGGWRKFPWRLNFMAQKKSPRG